MTGFGLAGHLLEMLRGAGVAAELDLSRIPLYPSVLALAQIGIASSLLPENSRLATSIAGPEAPDSAVQAILFDPQTAGGLLIGVPEGQAAACLDAIRAAGADEAAVVGRVVGVYDGAGPQLRLTHAFAQETS